MLDHISRIKNGLSNTSVSNKLQASGKYNVEETESSVIFDCEKTYMTIDKKQKYPDTIISYEGLLKQKLADSK